jgi:GxxExxY protein
MMGRADERAASGVIGAAIEVHRALGPGFLEAVYEEALAVEMELRGIPFRRQVPIALDYKGRPVGEAIVDLLVDECLIVELKAVAALGDIHVAQALSYLRAMDLRLALLINFNVSLLTSGLKRVIL